MIWNSNTHLDETVCNFAKTRGFPPRAGSGPKTSGSEHKQTICVVGVLILATKLCKADGHFTAQEEIEILKIIPHEPQQKNSLMI